MFDALMTAAAVIGAITTGFCGLAALGWRRRALNHAGIAADRLRALTAVQAEGVEVFQGYMRALDDAEARLTAVQRERDDINARLMHIWVIVRRRPPRRRWLAICREISRTIDNTGPLASPTTPPSYIDADAVMHQFIADGAGVDNCAP